MVKRPTNNLREVLQNLTTSEIKFRKLFEETHDGVLILDGVTGKITDSNPFIEQLLGYSKKELLGKQVWQISPFRDILANKQKFMELKKKRKIHYQNLPLETKSGKRAYVEFVSTAYSASGKSVIQCNIRDITERKRIEENLRDAYDKLEYLNKEKDIFVSLLAHELRSPLIPIMGYIEMMLDGKIGSLTDEQKEKLEICYRNAGDLNLLINDFLDLTRLDLHKVSLTMRKNNLVKVVREVLSNLETFANDHHARITIQSPQTVIASFDKLRMNQIMTNFVKNAIIHSQKKTINEINIIIEEKGKEVRVTIEDEGGGNKESSNSFVV